MCFLGPIPIFYFYFFTWIAETDILCRYVLFLNAKQIIPQKIKDTLLPFKLTILLYLYLCIFVNGKINNE